MKTKVTIISVFILSLIFSLAPMAQAQSEDVSSNLEVYRITMVNGEEVVEQVTTISPGDTLEYRLTYTNNLSNAISDLQPILPVPQGVQYLENTAIPELDEASLDAEGNTFQSLPIQREETLESGLVVEREVPAREYRRLRWSVPTLESQESVMLRARVWVINRANL